MPAVHRLGDSCSGHPPPGPGPRPTISASGNVNANGKGIVRAGVDSYDLHGDPLHSGKLSSGSSTVFVNGSPCGRVGDPVDCGSTEAAGGSGNVNAG